MSIYVIRQQNIQYNALDLRIKVFFELAMKPSADSAELRRLRELYITGPATEKAQYVDLL